MKTYTSEELKTIIEKHTKWLRNEQDGERADLSRADLSWANLSRANLSGANLSRADLSGADLSMADLSRADLSMADLDYSSIAWCCKFSRFKTNSKFIYQMFAHISTLKIIDTDDELKEVLITIKELAKKSHRASDLGLLEGNDEKQS